MTSRTSSYRGVSRHRLTKRWEASLWLNGRQLYLGGFNSQEDAAAAYDLAALACKGPGAVTNHAPEIYDEQLKEIAGLTRASTDGVVHSEAGCVIGIDMGLASFTSLQDEVVAYVRRRSSAFSRGKSKYRGVSGHNGRWEARIGSFGGRKNVRKGSIVYRSGSHFGPFLLVQLLRSHRRGNLTCLVSTGIIRHIRIRG